MPDGSPPRSPVVVLDHRDPSWTAALVELQRAAYRLEAALIGSDAIPPLHETDRELAGQDLTILAVLGDEGRPIAMLGYRRAAATVDIDRLAVHPDHQRRGLARRLIRDLHARERTARSFIVSTGSGNHPACALYEAAGYRPIGEETMPPGVRVTRFRWER